MTVKAQPVKKKVSLDRWELTSLAVNLEKLDDRLQMNGTFTQGGLEFEVAYDDLDGCHRIISIQ